MLHVDVSLQLCITHVARKAEVAHLILTKPGVGEHFNKDMTRKLVGFILKEATEVQSEKVRNSMCIRASKCSAYVLPVNNM